MKAIYKIILFFAIFQMTIVVVNLLGVFPNTFYSDIEVEDIQSLDNPVEFLEYFFSIPDLPGLGAFTTFTFAMLIFIFVGLGALYARTTQSWTPVVVAILIGSFVPMITKSFNLWNKLFRNWDSASVAYVGLMLGVGIILFVLFTIVETPTHGRGG